jgi:hypothetical protein
VPHLPAQLGVSTENGLTVVGNPLGCSVGVFESDDLVEVIVSRMVGVFVGIPVGTCVGEPVSSTE